MIKSSNNLCGEIKYEITSQFQLASNSHCAIYRKTTGAALAIIIMSSVTGCTSEQIYGSGQVWQRNQCLKMPDQDASRDCINNSNKSYDAYKYESQKVEKK
jgi:hypothetical protein